MINIDKSNAFSRPAQIAGLMPGDQSIEFFGIRETKKVIWLQNGCSHYFSDLPIDYFMLLKQAYLQDHKAQEFLSQVAPDQSRQIELYTYYMYGSLDGTPDIVNGHLGPVENFRDKRNCPSLLWQSKQINIGGHTLTPRQITIIDLIAKDLPNKAIADVMGIKLSTYDFHAANLFKAIGVTNKTALLKLAYQHKILN